MSIVPRTDRQSPNEVARTLGIHIATVWRWILHGVRGRKLSSVVIGGRRYITREALTDFLSTRNVPSNKIGDEFHRRSQNAGRLLDARGITRWKSSMCGQEPSVKC